MVIRFPLVRKPKEQRLESHPSGLNRSDSRRLSAREILHRERMLEHLRRIGQSR